MKNAMLGAISMLALGWVYSHVHNDPVVTAHSQPAAIHESVVAQAAPAPASAPAPAPHASLQQQTECKTTADRYLTSYLEQTGRDWAHRRWTGDREDDVFTVTSHMNAKLGVCFALVSARGNYIKDGNYIDPHQSYMIVDAVADRVYADYDWTNFNGKKYWEVKPTTCQFPAGDGTTSYCESEDEFWKGTHDLLSD